MPARAHSFPTPDRDAHDDGDDPIAIVWADSDGRPTRLVWAGARWRVSDRPTVITEPVSWWRRLDADAQTLDLAPRTCTGWRFQATADDGRSCVLDVRDEGDPARWFVVKVYE
ncbi:MAG: hypothetical protein K2X36_02620 [Microbacteriaceae bacterium]|nr:hypothetical protein [Microbacteriaceae bacterium]